MSEEPPPPAAVRSRRDLAAECAAVLAVGFVPQFLSSILWHSALLTSNAPLPPYWIDVASRIVHTAATGFVVCYLIGRSGELRERFGLVAPRERDALLGVVCFVTAVAYSAFIYTAPPPTVHRGVASDELHYYAVAFAYLFVAAYTEELIFRGYLIPRLTDLLGKSWLAVPVAAFLFGLIHLYQGPFAGLFSAGFGLLFGLAFLWLRSLWPLALGHALYNYMLVLLAWE